MSGRRARAPRLAVVCVDGATPAMVRAGRFFMFRQAAENQIQPLRTVYPSSTAPSHASMLTGQVPAFHGIVGNRYWEDESVATIRRSQDPLACLHPYDYRSLRQPSVLEHLSRKGKTLAAVMFPHTFTLRDETPLCDSAFCLYAPSCLLEVPVGGSGPTRPARPHDVDLPFSGLGFDLRFRVRLRVDRGDPRAVVTLDGQPQRWKVSSRQPADVVLDQQDRVLSFRLLVQHADDRAMVFRRSTAVLVFTRGAASATSLAMGPPFAHSAHPAYVSAGRRDFFEAPAAAWVTRAALELLDGGPDVLLVRYNQVDHAQEHLYWHAKHGPRGTQAAARDEILDTYREVESCIAQLLAELDPSVPILLFSDHGIDDIGVHLRPNALLDELGLADDFVFQGDTNCAYLYGDRVLDPVTRERLLRRVRASMPDVAELSFSELAALGGLAPGRCGQLVLRTAPHVAFQYGAGPAREEVEAAAHGFDPALPAMDGVFGAFGRWPDVPGTPSIIDLAALVGTVAGT